MSKQPYTKEWLEKLCAESYSLAEVLRKAGRSGGGAQTTLKKKIEEFNIDISHFTGQLWNKGKTKETDSRLAAVSQKLTKYNIEEVFCKDSSISQKVLRTYIKNYKVIPYNCETCGCDGNWQNGIIPLEVHHKDGDNTNNEISNLCYLCPNCHSLTDNYRGKNKEKNNNSTNISDEQFIEALKNNENIRQALIKLGLSPAGANYSRAKRLLEKINN